MSSPGDGYVPDPDRDSAHLVALFVERLADLFGAELAEAIRRRRRELELDDAVEPPDLPARYNRRYTSAVLAAYQVLSEAPGAPDGPALVECLTRAFVEPLGEAVTAGTRAMLDAADDPYAAMVAVARGRERDDFGAEFTFVHPADGGDRFFADVHRCGFHDYFRRHGAPELTPVLCAFDANWITAIDPDRHGFTFSRDTTIGLGGDRCPFHFQRVARPTVGG